MKRRQWIFYSLAAVLLIAGLLSGSRIFYVLLFTQMFLILLVLVINLWAVVTFTYTQELSSSRTLRGRTVTLSLAIHNEKPLPFPLMRVRLMVADEPQARLMTFNLSPYSQAAFKEEMDCPYRGSYDVGMTTIDFIDLFGLMRFPFDMRLLPYYRMSHVLVYPRLVELNRVNMPALDIQQFTHHQNQTDDHDQPYAMVRPYRAGDPARQIHWKISARLHQLMSRVYEQATEPSVELHLDLHRGGYDGELALQAEDVFCECATALIYFLLKQNWHVRITGYGRQIQHLSGSSLKDFQNIYQWLAGVPFDSHAEFVHQLSYTLVSQARSKARVILTTRLEHDLDQFMADRSRSRTPVYTLIAGPARTHPQENSLSVLFRQAGLPVWFVHYGDDLAKILQGQV